MVLRNVPKSQRGCVMPCHARRALGRSGVPVYVLYRTRGDPVLFPEVLQRQSLIDAIAAL